MEKKRLRKIVLPEGDDACVLAAACRLRDERIAIPILLGAQEAIATLAREANLDIAGIEIIDPRNSSNLDSYASSCAGGRETMTVGAARRLVSRPLYFAGMMVKEADADAMVAGAANPTRRVIEAGSMTVGLAPGISRPSSFFDGCSRLSRSGSAGVHLCGLRGQRGSGFGRACRHRHLISAQRRKIARRKGPGGVALVLDTWQRTACESRQRCVGR